MTKPYRKKIPTDRVYIPLLEMDFKFMPEEIETVIKMWNKGYDLRVMSKELNRDGDEIMVLLLDLARKSQIKPRENSIWGWRL